MIDFSLVSLTGIAFLAYIVKSTTGFGSAIVMVSLGSVVVGTYDAVILSAVLDLFGGGILFIQDPVADRRRFWVPLSIVIIIGSIVGGLLLKVSPAGSFNFLLATIILIFGIWFFMGRGGRDESALTNDLPVDGTKTDYFASALSGICCGLFGAGGPPLIYWFGRRFAKHAFRRTLIPMFLFSSFARLIVYGSLGLLGIRFLSFTLFSIPGILLGVFFGNRIFSILSERSFSRVVGGVLVIVAVRLMLGIFLN